MSNTYELKPRYISQKSFYKKAFVTVTNYSADVCYCLRSYNTYVVSLYVGRDGIPYVKKLWKGYSATMSRHVNEFLMQNGFPGLTARAWRAMEVGEFYSPDDVPALEKSLK